ncbi:MAG: hypothetical protein MRQ07_03235 [Candidatus Midichloria sp.]|nr:hypothetical protein [Candidatus Midichloria sp.]
MESGGSILHWRRVFDKLPKEMVTLDINKDNIGLFLSLKYFIASYQKLVVPISEISVE